MVVGLRGIWWVQRHVESKRSVERLRSAPLQKVYLIRRAGALSRRLLEMSEVVTGGELLKGSYEEVAIFRRTRWATVDHTKKERIGPEQRDLNSQCIAKRCKSGIREDNLDRQGRIVFRPVGARSVRIFYIWRTVIFPLGGNFDYCDLRLFQYRLLDDQICCSGIWDKLVSVWFLGHFGALYVELETVQCLRRELTGRKTRDSKPISASRLLLSRLRQPEST
ncbi:hypothetical protein CLF_102271 [Clonorchis sinensis]|uniref:Uncharacterized protein n=1 Tax=Clonorchis sinensis TaxID=79923 RepID=G7Y7M8_CLOSI|nr:hypothetical protein CLF_102271 [Clonorchis sinensis]